MDVYYYCYYCCCCCLLLVVSGVSGLTPVIYPGDITSSQCGQSDPLQDEQLMTALRLARQQLGPPGCNPPSNRSCQEILYCFPSSSSGYYQIHATNGSLVDVYCNMEGTNCGNITGWTRVAYLNMTQPHATCPPPLVMRNTTAGLTLCHSSKSGCNSVLYSTLDLSYSQVCGRVRGYQLGRTNGFGPFSFNSSIDFDGVTITYDPSTRNHIWTYASGKSEKGTTFQSCPCNNGSTAQSPPFVGDDYYCESGTAAAVAVIGSLHPSDPLWDGQQCEELEAPCCTHPNMPWFIKALGVTTTEDIELSVCSNNAPPDKDVPLELVELFVR